MDASCVHSDGGVVTRAVDPEDCGAVVVGVVTAGAGDVGSGGAPCELHAAPDNPVTSAMAETMERPMGLGRRLTTPWAMPALVLGG